MIVIGVAKPMAHGQAMISTATALIVANAIAGSGPTVAHTKNRDHGDEDDGGDDVSGQTIRSISPRLPSTA
jgi:hypothetical protein